MVHSVKGNIFDSEAEALVNPVNTVGVMGKGLALHFKKRYPHNYAVYRKACEQKIFRTGQVLTVAEGDLLGQKYILNFPTKEHWKNPSKLEYIATGLEALKEEVKKHDIKSIAIPPLGCGLGGLDWPEVKAMIVEILENIEADVFLYEPL